MALRKTCLVLGLVVALSPGASAQNAGPGGVAEIQNRHDRAFVRELSEYLIRNPQAEDREQAHAALFNKAIEHDWFAEHEEAANRYLKDEPDGPVRALAQIISIMARAEAGKFTDALVRFKELMDGLGSSDQEEFALSFTETLAASAVMAGEIDAARQTYQTLAETFSDAVELKQRVEAELNRLDRVGEPVANVEAQDLNGKTIRLSDLRGKYVLVDFWATWCGPCLVELPRLQEAYRKHHDAGLEIVSVSLDETRSAVVDFVKVRQLPWLQIHNGTAGADLVEAFGVTSIPASYLIDPDGTIVRLDLRGAKLEAALAELVKPAG